MNKENKVIALVGIFVVLTVALIVSLDRRMKSSEVNLGDESDSVVFADIGHFALATAGNNNAVLETGEYIYSLPTSNPNITYNWLQVKNEVGNNITYNNFSGSYLHVDGTIKKMILNYTSRNTGTGTRQILVVFPNGQYTLETVTGDEGVIDITNKVNPKEADGWYYVSFIGFDENKYLAWAIEAVYENQTLPLRTVELYKLNQKIRNSEKTFNYKLTLDRVKESKLVGVISSYSDTNTKAYAHLSNGTPFQLYERTGNTFRGRNNVHFLINQIDAERMPSKDLGGAIDLFDQDLSRTYFEGETMNGFYFKNTSNVDVNVMSLGVQQDVYEPNITVDTDIIAPEKFKTNDSVTIKTQIKNNTTDDGVCAKVYKVNISSLVDLKSRCNGSDCVLENVTNIKARYKETNYTATYESNNQRVVLELQEFDCSSPIDISFDATVGEIINSLTEGDVYKIKTEAQIDYNLINTNESFDGNRLTVKDTATATSLKRILVTASYLDLDTNTNLVEPVVQELFFGDDYVTAPSEDVSEDYELTAMPINYIGTHAENDINVKYIYEIRKATITTRYVDRETGFPLHEDDVQRKVYGEAYTTTQLTITDYDQNGYDGVVTGTVKGDVIVTYYYVPKTGTVTVRHVDLTTGIDLEAPTTTSYKYHTRYSVTPKDIFTNYLYDSVLGEPSGEIVEDSITVIFYYKKKPAEIYIYHLIDGTNETLVPRETRTEDVYWGDEYTTSPSPNIPNNYELKTKTDNYAGFIKENRVEVFYYYQKKDSRLSTSILMDGTKKITSKNDKVTYNFTYSATTVDYIGDGVVTIVDTLPYAIDVAESNLADGVYNEDNKTITWTFNWENIDSYDINKSSFTVNKKITVLYKDLDATNRTMVNTVTGKVVLDNNERTVEEKYKTDVLIPGTILVHHYLVGTHQRIFDDETSTGLSGETYISTAKYKEGYRLVTEKQSQSHVYVEDVTEVVYEYEHLSYDITVTNTTEDKGSVTGTEKVYYGEDSKEDYIVIKANEGYEIETIVVDGEEIEVTDKNEMILENFKNVHENHTVDVTFTEVLIPVPITGRSSYIWIVALVTISIIGIMVIPKLFLGKKDN